MLLEAWEKGTIGRESVDLPSPTDSSCSRSPGPQKDFSEHTPVFSQIYSPVQKETRPTERGKQAADSTTVTESQRDGHLSRVASTAIPTGSPRESHKPSARSTTTPTGSPRESHTPSARSTTTPTGSPRESHTPSAGSAQEPNVSSEETKASPEALSHAQPTGSHQEMTEEDPDLSVDMELLVDTLRNMEPSEIRKPPKISRLSRCSSRGKYATLPPIDEYHIAPKSQVPFPEENVDPSGEEEEEIENPYLSKDEKPQAKEEPRKVYPWENMSAEIEEKTLSLLGKLRQPPGDEKASRNQSILFNANILKGASLLKELQEQKAVPTEDKPYSRLNSSLLYRRYVSSVTPPLKALEKEREGRSSPTPIDPALLNASRQSWMPPNGPQLKPCEQLTSEPSPAGLQEMTRVLSLDPQKAPGTDKNTGQIPLLFVEAEQKNTPPPLLGHPAAGVSKSTLCSRVSLKSSEQEAGSACPRPSPNNATPLSTSSGGRGIKTHQGFQVLETPLVPLHCSHPAACVPQLMGKSYKETDGAGGIWIPKAEC
uniref:Uncharacterized protein n=1 Tax=Gopherus evgoodei TaxID=1825980 RepID=A0A8C4YSP3_9SAUR